MIIDNVDEMLDQAADQPLVMGIAHHPYILGQPYRLRHLRRALTHIATQGASGSPAPARSTPTAMPFPAEPLGTSRPSVLHEWRHRADAPNGCLQCGGKMWPVSKEGQAAVDP